MFLIDKIHPLAFVISLCIGLLFCYIFNPTPELIIKYPTPENVHDMVYEDDADNCYKFTSEEVTCPKNKGDINDIPVQRKVHEFFKNKNGKQYSYSSKNGIINKM